MSLPYGHDWLSLWSTFFFVKLDQSPSLSFGFWMWNWEKHPETRSGLQHHYVKCSSLEQFHIDCTLKSLGTLKTSCWVGLGHRNGFDWFGIWPGYDTLKQSYLVVHSIALKKKKKNTETPKISGIKASGIALISAISEAYLFNSFLDYIRYSNILLIN